MVGCNFLKVKTYAIDDMNVFQVEDYYFNMYFNYNVTKIKYANYYFL